jgi:hypothetical protein
MEEIRKLAGMKEENLRIMLVELNKRSRWYSSELWQVPFAYLGLSGALIMSVVEKQPSYLCLAFLASTIFGIFVLIHMHRIRKNERRSIDNIEAVEAALGLPAGHTAKVREGWKIFQWLVATAVIASSLGAIVHIVRLFNKC